MTGNKSNKSAYLMTAGVGLFTALMMAGLAWLEVKNGGPAPGEIGVQGNIGRVIWVGAGLMALWGVVGYFGALSRFDGSGKGAGD